MGLWWCVSVWGCSRGRCWERPHGRVPELPGTQSCPRAGLSHPLSRPAPACEPCPARHGPTKPRARKHLSVRVARAFSPPPPRTPGQPGDPIPRPLLGYDYGENTQLARSHDAGFHRVLDLGRERVRPGHGFAVPPREPRALTAAPTHPPSTTLTPRARASADLTFPRPDPLTSHSCSCVSAPPGKRGQQTSEEWLHDGPKATRSQLTTDLKHPADTHPTARTARENALEVTHYKQLKGELGLDHYEGRSCSAYHHTPLTPHGFLTLTLTQTPAGLPSHRPPVPPLFKSDRPLATSTKQSPPPTHPSTHHHTHYKTNKALLKGLRTAGVYPHGRAVLSARALPRVEAMSLRPDKAARRPCAAPTVVRRRCPPTRVIDQGGR